MGKLLSLHVNSSKRNDARCLSQLAAGSLVFASASMRVANTVTAGTGGGSAGPAPTWAPSAEQLNRAPLLARDPILFYDEVPLYESELDDNGVARLSVKARRCTLCR